MEILWEGTVSAEFRAIRPKLCESRAFPQNFHTRKLDEITVFFVVRTVHLAVNIYRNFCYLHIYELTRTEWVSPGFKKNYPYKNVIGLIAPWYNSIIHDISHFYQVSRLKTTVYASLLTHTLCLNNNLAITVALYVI